MPDDVQELLCRAEEACAMAARLVSPEARLMLFAVAKCYQNLAECVARHAQSEQMLPEIKRTSWGPTKAKRASQPVADRTTHTNKPSTGRV